MRNLVLVAVAIALANFAATAGISAAPANGGAVIIKAPSILVLVGQQQDCLNKCKVAFDKCMADAQKTASQKKQNPNTMPCVTSHNTCMSPCDKLPK